MSYSSIKTNWPALNRKLKNLARNAGGWQRSLRESNSMIMTEIDLTFQSQGSRLGKQWPPLVPATWDEREALGYQPKRPILIRDGTLQRGFRQKVLSPIKLLIENPVKYARVHQLGSDKIPTRPMFLYTTRIRRAIMQAFTNELVRKLKAK